MKNISFYLILALIFIGIALAEQSRNYSTIDPGNGLNRGDWGAVDLCPEGTFVAKMELKYDPRGNLDDTCGNGLKLYCVDTSGFMWDYVTSSVGKFGEWQGIRNCAPGQFMIGFTMKVEPELGRFDDDLGVVDIRMECDDSTIVDGLITQPKGEKTNMGATFSKISQREIHDKSLTQQITNENVDALKQVETLPSKKREETKKDNIETTNREQEVRKEEYAKNAIHNLSDERIKNLKQRKKFHDKKNQKSNAKQLNRKLTEDELEDQNEHEEATMNKEDGENNLIDKLTKKEKDHQKHQKMNMKTEGKHLIIKPTYEEIREFKRREASSDKSSKEEAVELLIHTVPDGEIKNMEKRENLQHKENANINNKDVSNKQDNGNIKKRKRRDSPSSLDSEENLVLISNKGIQRNVHPQPLIHNLTKENLKKVLGKEINLGKVKEAGDWGPLATCPSGKRICGIQTQVEEEKPTSDDAGLCNMVLLCCDFN